jgi:hypothetical protein
MVTRDIATTLLTGLGNTDYDTGYACITCLILKNPLPSRNLQTSRGSVDWFREQRIVDCPADLWAIGLARILPYCVYFV